MPVTAKRAFVAGVTPLSLEMSEGPFEIIPVLTLGVRQRGLLRGGLGRERKLIRKE